eukprot:923464-Rhodomonas_salina.1
MDKDHALLLQHIAKKQRVLGSHHRQTEVAEEATKVWADRVDHWHSGAAVEAGAEAEEADVA